MDVDPGAQGMASDGATLGRVRLRVELPEVVDQDSQR
jgi:hypothetical protein